MKTPLLKRVVEEDALDTLEWAKPLNFQESYEKITSVRQIAESSYLLSRTVLELNIIITRGQYIRPADFELVLPVRFQGSNGEKINLAESLPVKNFFGHVLETKRCQKRMNLKQLYIQGLQVVLPVTREA